MSNQKSSDSSDDLGVIALFAVVAFIVVVVILPITLISLPLAVLLNALLDEEKVLSRYSFGLLIGAIGYFFLFGVHGLNFEGLLFSALKDQTLMVFNLLMELKPEKLNLYPDFPRDVRAYFWCSYPVAIVLSIFMKMKSSKEKKKQKDYFSRTQTYAFENILRALEFTCLPFVFMAKRSVMLANRYFTSRLRAQIFAVSLVVLFYVLIYLTFGWPFGWYMHFGYFLNKGVIIFKLVPPGLMEGIKYFVYFEAVMFPLVWWNTKSKYALDLKVDPLVVTSLGNSFRDGSVRVGSDQNNKEVVLTPEMLNHHVHVVGASGFGKTTFLLNIIKEKIDSGEGLVFVDLKGDIDTVCEIATFVTNANRLNDFEFFSISEDFLEVSSGISLFDNGNALEIKDKIMGAFNYDHDYYKKRIESFLTLSLRALVYLRDNKGERFDLDSIYKLILGFEHIEMLASSLDREDMKRDLLSLVADKKLKEDLTGLRADIEGLIKTDFGHLFSRPDGINFYNSIRESKIVFIHLDSQRYEASAEKLGRLILQDIKTASAKIVTTIASCDREPFTLIVDEFANLATEQFVSFLNRARASGIGIVIAHQELSDLEAFSPVVKDQIMTNTSTLISFLQKLPKSAEMISGIAGTYRTEKETHQVNEEGLIFKTSEKTGMGSLREVEEYIIHPNLIKELGRGECFMVSKYPYTKIAKVFVNFINEPIMNKYELMEILESSKSEYVSLLGHESNTYQSDKKEEGAGDWL